VAEKVDQGQGCTKNPGRTDVQEETSGETRRYQCNKDPRLKVATTSEEREDIWQDFRETSGLEIVKQLARSSVRIRK
jgi:hypothetical protein